MKYWPFVIAMAASVTGFFGCSKPAPVEVPQAAHVFSIEPLDLPVTFASSADAQAVCDKNLGHVERLRTEIKSVTGKHTRENTLEPLNEMDIAFERILGVSELMANTHPDEAVRTEAEKCTERASEILTQIQMDPALFAAVNDVDKATLDARAKFYVEKTLQDYKLAGVDKDEATRAQLAELNKQLVKSGQAFDKNIRDDRKTVQFTVEQLAGLPEDFMAAHQPDENGMITISTDYTDYFPVMNYAKSEETRKTLSKVFTARAYPANDEVFKDMLKERNQIAKLTGFDNWAAYNASDKMAKDTATISTFINDIAAITEPRYKAELEDLMALKKADNPDADGFYPWDRFYYIEALKKQKYDFDAQSVRQYFPYEKVKRGILNVASTIYGVTFQQSDRPVWHDSVEAYDVYEGDQLIARFYLDMHPREGKYGHAASFGMYSGIEGLQLPAATLVCNFPQPTPSNPALMEHNDVTTFFHEFGHLLHQLFAGRHHWAKQSGINCEWDFVEAPSQLFEDWAWDYDVLKRFAVNDKGEVIPKELVEKMKQADEVGKGVLNMRQISYAALSYNYHVADPDNIDLLKIQSETFAKYSPFKPFDGDYTFASFGHLNGYSSMYYTYMWSLAIAKDLGQPFHANGLLNVDTAHQYREKVLSVGGAQHASDMVHNFLGRDYNLDAFKAWLSK
ncbi:MAG: Zn-dependent oligopeptidase [Proteobacteria bacterium]|nr:Zn-dependent oligopeptidase [Pseudomonadota bacterium]